MQRKSIFEGVLSHPLLHTGVVARYLQSVVIGVLVAMPCASVSASPVGNRSDVRARAQHSQGKASTSRKAPEQDASTDPFADLAPARSGSGVIVLDPIAPAQYRDLARFGGGCSRWMQYVIGGHGEIGKTPDVGEIELVRRERGLPDLRLSPVAADSLAAALGATHIVTAAIRGTVSHLRLEYEVRRRGDRRVLAIITLVGSDSGIVQALPGAASRIARVLGVAHPRVPSTCAVGADGLRVLGSLPCSPSADAPVEDANALIELARREPAAAVPVILASGFHHARALYAARRTLLTSAHDNVLAYHTVAAMAGDRPEAVRRFLEALGLEAKYPANYLLADSHLQLALSAHDLKEDVKRARRAVECAPGNPMPWFRLGYAYANVADSVRHGRMIAQMTSQELETVSGIYPFWAAAEMHAVVLDVRFSRAWLALSKSAAFSGAADIADEAFGKSLALEPNDHETLWWGLEMYQPKWFENRLKLDRVVRIAARADYTDPADGANTAVHIAQAGEQYRSEARRLAARMESAARGLMKSMPESRHAREVLSSLERLNGVWAIPDCLALAQRLPDEEANLVRLARITVHCAQATQAIELLQAAVARHPGSRALNCALGGALIRNQRTTDGEALLRHVVDANPGDVRAWELLAEALISENRKTDAADVYKRVLRLDPHNPAAHLFLFDAFYGAQRWDEALAEGREVLKSDPQNTSVRSSVATILERRHDYAGAILEWRALLPSANNMAGRSAINRDIAWCLNADHRKDEALHTYQIAFEEDPDGPSGSAARANIKSLGGVVDDLLDKPFMTEPRSGPHP